jgi:hypothetical protein
MFRDIVHGEWPAEITARKVIDEWVKEGGQWLRPDATPPVDYPWAPRIEVIHETWNTIPITYTDSPSL